MQVLVCVCDSIHTVLRVAYVMYASVQIHYKLDSTLQLCRLQGGCIQRYKLPLCKTSALKWVGGGGGIYSGVGLYSEFYSTLNLPVSSPPPNPGTPSLVPAMVNIHSHAHTLEDQAYFNKVHDTNFSPCRERQLRLQFFLLFLILLHHFSLPFLSSNFCTCA